MRHTGEKKQHRADAEGKMWMQNKKTDRKYKRPVENRWQTKKRYEKTDDRLYRRKKDVRFRFKKERVPQPGITVYVLSKKDNAMIILSYLFSCCFKRFLYRKSKFKSPVYFQPLMSLMFIYFQQSISHRKKVF